MFSKIGLKKLQKANRCLNDITICLLLVNSKSCFLNSDTQEAGY